MKTIFLSLRTAAIVLLLSVCALAANAAVTITQNQNRVASTTFGKGTTNQAILEVKLVADAAETVTNAKFTLTGADQIARVAVYPNQYGNPDFSKSDAIFASIDNPGATVSFDGSYAISGTRYLTLVVDFKADASTGTQIDAVCTEITSTAGTFTPSATTSTKTITVADNLSGTKTVKNSGGDYATLTAAIADINLFGVGTGGLTIEVADDQTFTQTASGNDIRQSGSVTNPLVIKRSGTGTNKPIIIATNNGASNFDTNIGFAGVDYVTIDGLDFRATGGTGKTEHPIRIYGLYNRVCNYIEIKNCDIDCATSTLPSDYGIYLISNAKGTVYGAAPNTNIKIHDNTITNAKSGIYVNYNITATVKDSGHEIYNNTITAGTVNTFANGIRYKYCNGIKIYNNTIDGTGHTSTAAIVGIGADSGSSISGTVDIYGNSIKNLTTNTNNDVFGLYLTGSTGSIINAYNNAIANISNIHTSTTKTTAGIRKDGAGITNLWHNSVYINQTVTNTGIVTAAFSDNASSEVIQFINNVFVNTSVTGGDNTKNSTFSMSNNNKIAAGSDNNLYYPINATTRIKVGTSYYSTIADYKTALADREQNSISEMPPFVSVSDLHLTSESNGLSNSGKPVAMVAYDIDGHLRSTTTPDMGADEIRLGADTIMNKKPTINPVANPADVIMNSGIKAVQLTGISDGNSERDETLTITATSNNETVVANSSIAINYTAGSSTATLSYEPVGAGVATITVTVKDDKGTLNIGEEDTNTISFTLKSINPALNHAPTIGTITSKVYANRGQQIIAIPNISDGDINKVQNITISAISKDTNILTIDSVVYKTGNSVGFIYVKEHQKLGTVDIELTLTDDGNTGGGEINQAVITHPIEIQSFKNPCANFVEYDAQHWQPRPLQNDPPTVGSYQKICSTITPIESKARDFFWMKMYGYIIPSKTEYYNFQGFSNEGFHMFMNLAGGPESDWSKLTALVEGIGTQWTSDAYLLEAGKPYYFEAYAREIVSTQPFWLKWTSASTPLNYISGDNLAPFYDVTKPTTPQNFRILSTGLNDVLLNWDASSDNRNNLQGYNVFVDGVLQNSSPITETSYKVDGLSKNTTYNVHIVAVDDSDNSSYPTPILIFKTFDDDTVAPTTPTNVTSTFETAFSVQLKWNKSTDAETEIRGYNIFQDNVLVKELVKDTTSLVTGLTQLTNYNFTVEAVDANYNKSAKSAAYNVSTVAFDPNETRDGIRKGRMSFKLNPLTKFEGIGLNLGFTKTSLISNNLVSFGDFEGGQVDTMRTANLSYYNKAISNANFEKNLTSPYAGKVSAKIIPIAGGYFRCQIGTQIDKQYTYLVRFAMKKDASFTGNVTVGLKGMFAGSTNTLTFTPTTEWAIYEGELNTTYEGGEASWYLDFTATSNGSFHLDNIQFVEKGNYVEGEKFAKRTMDLLKEFKPAHIRWGGIQPANSVNFKYASGVGTGAIYSYADWIELANQLKTKAYISIGVGPQTDFFLSTAATMKKFVEYVAGDASTDGGKLRTAEGYGDLMANSKGMFIELGNEVWGTTHGTGTLSDYSIYGTWARGAITALKGTTGFDTNKIKVAYSGRYPGLNYGLHANLLAGDKGEGDILAISGYMGGNMNLDPNIPLTTSQLDYHKSSIAKIQTNLEGLKNDWREMLATCNRILPMYMYEGNMTTDSYYGTIGQAVTFADYYTTVPLYGVPDVSIFTLEGGQWRLIDNAITYKKMPLFTIGKYINNYCTGALLETNFTSSFKIANENGTNLTIDPVGVKAYTDSTSYSVAMFSRDFENDYQVQVDIPDFIGNSATCKKIVISANHFTDRDVTVTEEMISNFADSLLVTVPKYSVVILKFEGNDQNYDPAPVYQDYKKIESVKITQAENKFYINVKRGKLTLGRTYTPNDAFSPIMKWTLLDNETVKAYFVENTTSITLYSTGVSSGNGTIRVVCAATDLSGKADTVSVVISNQVPNAIDQFEAEIIDMYPNPTKDYLRVIFPESISGHLFIMDLNGKSIKSEAIRSKETVLDVEGLKPGVYLLRISTAKGSKILKFVKQ